MDSLPDEVLEEIFKHINLKDLLNLTLVCKRFNEIISRSWFSITQKDILVIHCHSDYWLKKSNIIGFTTLERKCPKLKLYGFSDIENYQSQKQRFLGILRALRAFGINITSLKIPDGEISLDIFNEILKTMPNISQLSFGKFAEIRIHVLMDAIEQQTLQNLRTLKFTYATSSCLEILSQVKSIETVKLANYSAFLKRYFEPGNDLKSVVSYMDNVQKILTRRSQFSITSFKNFLMNQEKLKFLELVNFSEQKLFKYLLRGRFRFELETFAFKFQECQYSLESNFFETLVESSLALKNLKTLELEFNIEKLFVNFKKFNSTIEILKLTVGFGNPIHFRVFLENLIKALPNVSKFSVETRKIDSEFPNLGREDICYINDLQNLEELTIKRCSLDTMSYTTLPCLETLSLFIDHDHLLVDHSENFMHFLGRHPDIRVLKFESDYYLTDEVLEKLLYQKPYLTVLKLPVFSLEAVEIITDYCEHLMELYLNMRHCFQDKKCTDTIQKIIAHLISNQFKVQRNDKYLIAIKMEKENVVTTELMLIKSESFIKNTGRVLLIDRDKTFSDLSSYMTDTCQCVCCQIS
jgi:hypothetical protein